MDPGLFGLKSAARAAIVMPAVFAFADTVIDDPQIAAFAAFGSFAMLVLADFGGPVRARLLGYVSLALTGAGLIAIATACSRNAWLAAGAMAVVGFGILFSGAINGYFAAGGPASILAFVLPVTIPAPLSAIPTRLEGWLLAAGVAIAAHFVLWPGRPPDGVRVKAVRACRALADVVEAELAADRELVAQTTAQARTALTELRRAFVGSPHRPGGSSGREAALASLVDELEWLGPFVLAADSDETRAALCPDENREVNAAIVSVLRAAEASLDGTGVRPELDRLERARRGVARTLAQRLAELRPDVSEEEVLAAVEPSFRLRAASYAAGQVATYAIAATGERATPSLRPSQLEELAVEHAGVRSVWFRNALRGASGLAAAVLIAHLLSLQHAFWVVLGTLSVLRSNALATGATIVRALVGTAIGIAVGVGLILAIGTDRSVLWIVLPLAVLLAAYAPRGISFAAGQAGFTIVVVILFNIIQPTGWKVGLVRIEDVAIGFAISLGVGFLFWPRGTGRLLGENLASAYARSADYVLAATLQLVGKGDDRSAGVAAQRADAAIHRLDDAFRSYLGERAAGQASVDNSATLVGGASRVRRAAESLRSLARMAAGAPALEGCSDVLDDEVYALRSWYTTLGDVLAHDTSVPPPHLRGVESRRRLLQCVRDAVTHGDKDRARRALALLWASQHLDNLWRLESYLVANATGAAPSAPGDRRGNVSARSSPARAGRSRPPSRWARPARS